MSLSVPVAYGRPRQLVTAERFARMVEAGIYGPDDRVELIEGEILEMSPIGPSHAATVTRLATWLVTALGDRANIRVQSPIRCGDLSQPEPDIAVAAPRADFYRYEHPGPAEVTLVIEVGDSTIRFDREVKAPLYGRQGIPETWVVDIERRTVDVFTDPDSQGYRRSLRHDDRAVLRPTAFPDLAAPVAELLP